MKQGTSTAIFSVALLSATLLAGCAGGQARLDALQAEGRTPATAAELTAFFADTTGRGKTDRGNDFVVYRTPDGEQRGLVTWSGGSDQDVGRWWVVEADEDIVCFAWERWRDGAERCFQVYLHEDRTVTWVGRVGTSEIADSSTPIEEGNTGGL